MKKQIISIMAVTALGMTAQAISYTGSLNAGSSGGITATADWNSSSTVFSWTVEDVGVSAGSVLWKYTYSFTVPAKNISHLNLELSDGAVKSDFTFLVGTPDEEATTYVAGGSQPNQPGPLYGFKYSDTDLSSSISFTTTRSPVWGDFYAKDGRSGGVEVTAWNTGFLTADPSDAAANGSILNHILRPDTRTTAAVPDGGLTLGMLGLGLLGLRASRKVMA